jgi:inosine-uridine nucleoside N-ribohydrolase
MKAVMHRVILDTDIGTDVDDLWTLAMVPAFPEIVLEAVTVVYGDTELRARLASVACSELGLDVPICRGRETTMSGKDVMWAGHEGVGVAGLESASYSPDDAVELLVAAAASHPGTLDVVAIGPLTNLAAAIEADDDFAGNLRHLTVMGGEFARGWSEHNFSADATATATVFNSGVSATIMPLDQTLRVLLTRADAAAIAAVHPMGPLMADQAERFWQWISAIIPASTGDSSPAHDPLALLALVQPDLFTFTPMAIAVDHEGKVTGTPDEASLVRVVTDLDVVECHRELLGSFGVS